MLASRICRAAAGLDRAAIFRSRAIHRAPSDLLSVGARFSSQLSYFLTGSCLVAPGAIRGFSSETYKSQDDVECEGRRKEEEGVVTRHLRQMLEGVREGNRASLAEAITLVESTHPVKNKQAQWLLSQTLAHRNREQAEGTLRSTIRVGLSGPPGAGKSTLVETLGLRLLAAGYRVAVLVG